MMYIIVAALVILFVITLHVVFPKQYSSPRDYWLLRKIPGLPTYPYFGSAHIFLVPNDEFLPLLVRICDTYKPICKVDILGVIHVFFTDINDISLIFNSRLHIEKSEDYLFLIPWLGTGLLTSTGKKWFQHRKLLTPAFHFQILEQNLEALNRNAKILVEQLNNHAKNEFVELNPLITLCTLDVICETAMGTPVNAQIGGEKEYVKATLRMSQIFQKRLVTPWMYRPFLFNLQPLGKEQQKQLKILHGFTQKVIRERKDYHRQHKILEATDDWINDIGAKKKMSFLDIMVKMSENGNGLTEEEIREEVDTFMFEGHDTTAAAISWTIFELGHHPEIQEKAYLEQCEIFEGSLRPVSSSDLHKMKYLERVIKEALRLYPSVPVISRRLETDITIRGYKIPAGTNIPAFIYYIHRDPSLYPDPLKFDPDRFLPEQILHRHPYAYIPFSAGARNCIGQRFAEMEEKAILSHVIRNFRFKSLDKREDIKTMGELILRPKYNLKMEFSPRH